MPLVQSIIILIVLLLAALAGIWFFLFKTAKKETLDELSDLDKDLLKTRKSANIFKEVPYVLQAAFFIVSIFTYSLITYAEPIQKEEVVFIPPPPPEDGKEIDIPPTDIPPPPPPKPKVVQVIKEVPDDLVDPEIPEDTLRDPFDDDAFGDLMGEPEPEKPKQVVSGPITTATPDVIPTFKNGGDVGIERTIYAYLDPHKESIEAGEYFFLMSYLVDEKGRLSQAKIVETDAEDAKFKGLMVKAVSALQGWNPGQKDNTEVRSLIEKEFFIVID